MEKRIKRISAIILMIQIILQMSMPLISEAVTGTSDSRFEYSIKSDKTSITITKYIGTDTEVIIPSTIDGYIVTSIGYRAFSGCSSLTSINIPESVTGIGDSAFSGCSSLTNIEIPKGVTRISRCEFSGCSSLTNIEIPEGVTMINYQAFNGCSSLTSINIPESVTSIDDLAFSGCSSLTNIEIPKGVTNIGNRVFFECSSLSNIEVDEKNEKYKCINGVLYTKDGTQLKCYLPKKEETEYTILEGVTSVGEGAFSLCKSLTSISIPEGVTSIGDLAFYGCSSLTNMEIPKGVTSIGDLVFYECSSLTSINIPEGVTSIGDYAFRECTSLTSIEIPKGVTNIGESAFEECSSLTSISIPEGVTSIDYGTFKGCSSLTSIEIPEGVTSIGVHAFSECNSLTSIEIPESVTIIGNWAFFGCSSLTKIEVPEGVTSIGGSVFYKCSSLTSIEIPKSVTSIGESAFARCSSLISIEIPESVTSIGGWAFSRCSSLIKIEVPEGVTSIGEAVFYDCSSLKSISIPESVTSIGKDAFENCTKLIIKCKTNSIAHQYAQKNNVQYELDDIGPTLTVEYSTKNPTNQYVEVTIKSNEELQRLKDWTLSEDKMSLSKTYTSNANETVIVKDLVGNSSITNVNIENIDKLAPTLTVEYSTTNVTNQNIEVTIKSNEKIQAVDGWTLSSDKLSLSKTYTSNVNENVTVLDLAGNGGTAQVKIDNIDKLAPTLTVEYSTTNITNQNVVVTIKSNEKLQGLSGWTLSSDKLSLSKTYISNGSESVTILDLAGNSSIAQVKIDNIDKLAPTLTVEYSTKNPTNKDIVVTIKSNEKVQTVDGWILSSDGLSLSKTYTVNESENIVVKDLVGNGSIAQVKVSNIDKVEPKVEGVENEKVYNSVTIKVTDENLNTVVLTKDGEEISYQEGMTIKEKGTYIITATDKAQNSTKVTFTIVEKAEMSSTKYTIDEENKYILGMKVGITKEEIRENLTTNIGYKLVTKEGQEVTTQKIATGMKIEFETGESYELVVTGDTNGDGKISTTDITKIKKHIIQKELLQGCYEKAGNVNTDTKISVTDLAKIKKALVGLTTL